MACLRYPARCMSPDHQTGILDPPGRASEDGSDVWMALRFATSVISILPE
jgi:hypothetical protein